MIRKISLALIGMVFLAAVVYGYSYATHQAEVRDDLSSQVASLQRDNDQLRRQNRREFRHAESDRDEMERTLRLMVYLLASANARLAELGLPPIDVPLDAVFPSGDTGGDATGTSGGTSTTSGGGVSVQPPPSTTTTTAPVARPPSPSTTTTTRGGVVCNLLNALGIC